MKSVEEIEAQLAALPPEKYEAIKREVLASTARWHPNPGPQTDAYYSKADVLLFGGEPGGGKTQLVLGLAYNMHQRSLIMRRRYTDIGAMTDALIEINGGRNGYNGSIPPSLRIGDRKLIEFGAANQVGDEQGRMGQAVDFLGADEATQFAEMQIRFLMGWVRSTDPKQRRRIVLATNPPLTAEGLWVTKMFAPWIDPTYPKPAGPGELRWVVTDEHGEDRWVDGPNEVWVGTKLVKPMSRTFIPSSLQDNPFLFKTGYQASLDAMPEPYRSILLGGFKATFKDAENQVIPTEWIKEAQERWTKKPPEGVPMSAMGVDASGGGDDPMVIAPRYDGWYAPLISIKGKDIPKDRLGTFSGGVVISHRRNRAVVVVDLGGGYGNTMYEHLKANDVEVVGYKGSQKTDRRSKGARMKFFNKRSETIWRFREALDPDQEFGSPIALPPSPGLMADLAAPTLDMEFNGIKVESKEDVCKRLGRSTNEGDAVVMAWSAGSKALTDKEVWGGFMRTVKVVMGRQARV